MIGEIVYTVLPKVMSGYVVRYNKDQVWLRHSDDSVAAYKLNELGSSDRRRMGKAMEFLRPGEYVLIARIESH